MLPAASRRLVLWRRVNGDVFVPLAGIGNTDCPFGCIAVFAPTPLPTALPLLATGIGALGLLGWRRKRKAQAEAN